MTVEKMPPEIATPRLLLRAIGEPDLEYIVSGVGDFTVSRMLSRVPFPYSRADAEHFLADTRRNAGRDVTLAIALEGRLIGIVGLTGLRQEAEFGYWIGRSFWGKGYATEAGRGLLAFVFRQPDVGEVRSGVFADNPASLRVQEKLGFRVTGRRRVRSLSRGVDVDHIDTVLTPGTFSTAGSSSVV